MNNEIVQLRADMVNFIGAIINASQDTPRITKHKVSSILLEETLNLAKDENIYDFFILKPLFRANIIVFQNKLEAINKDLEELPDELSQQLKEKQKSYSNIIQMMNNLLNELDKNQGDI